MPITRAERIAFGRLAIIEAEASYNAGYTGTGGDNQYLLEDPFVATVYQHDGNRGRSWHNGGLLMPSGRGGSFGTVSLQTQAGGSVNAWSATIRPSIHRLLQGCGHAAVLDATAAAEKWTYTPPAYPLPNSDQSLAMKCYAHGLDQILTGAFGSFTFDAPHTGIPTWTFDYTGVLGTVTDQIGTPVPTAAPISTAYPVAQGVIINIGSYLVARVRSFKFTQNREVVPRTDQTATLGVAGVVGARRSPEWELLLEAPVKTGGFPGTGVTGIDPYYLQGGGEFDLKYKCYTGGSYAPYRFEIPRAFLKPDGFASEVDEGNVVLWRLSGHCGLFDPGAVSSYDYQIVFPTN